MSRRNHSPSPYEILGVSPLDDFTTIRAAWRRLVKTCHPDVWYGTAEEATARLMAVNDAYDLISVLHNRVRAEAETRSRSRARARRTLRQAQAKAVDSPSRAGAKGGDPAGSAALAVPNRPSPVAGRFDAARTVFTGVAAGQVLAFA